MPIDSCDGRDAARGAGAVPGLWPFGGARLERLLDALEPLARARVPSGSRVCGSPER
ncbi:MAG: hypothetical protein M5U28_05730 [Sandaracinaceae bacterium]|nr:hypothetical protein [Sandaracinaceae bacterium]